MAEKLQTIKIKKKTVPKLKKFAKDNNVIQYEFASNAIEEKIIRESKTKKP